MLTGESFIIDTALVITYIALALSIVIGAIRLIKGPTLPDRVVALDLIAYIVIAFIAAYAIGSSTADFLDAAIVVALVAFLGTVAFARYVQQAGKKGKEDELA